jgi:hypothetical protein
LTDDGPQEDNTDRYERRGIVMRSVRLIVLPAIFVLLAAACQAEEGGDTEGGNTGSVNVLSAVEPEEAEVVQAVFDEHINADADYTAEIEASGNFEEQVQIRAEGGTLDVILLPQPGAVLDHAASGNAVSPEDLTRSPRPSTN